MKIVFQLDYYMSGQFAGLAMAKERGLFAQRGIDCVLHPPCEPGEEASMVLLGQEQDPSSLWLGSMEQNNLIDASISSPSKLTAIGAMFKRSPLALAVLPTKKGMGSSLNDMQNCTIGVHCDTIEILRALMPTSARLVEVDRKSCLGHSGVNRLITGELDAVQLYDTTEVAAIHKAIGAEPIIIPLCLSAGAGSKIDLGYAQTMFGCSDKVAQYNNLVELFLEALFEGWRMAIHDPIEAGRTIASMNIDNDGDAAFFGADGRNEVTHAACTARCAPYVQAMVDTNGKIEKMRWEQIESAIRSSKKNLRSVSVSNINLFEPSLASKSALVQEKEKSAFLPDGLSLARAVRSLVREQAAFFSEKMGRRPCLAVLRTAPPESRERLEAFSTESDSWHNLEGVLSDTGIKVHLIYVGDDSKERLSSPQRDSSTYQQVHDAILRCNRDSNIDAIFLQRPFPPMRVGALTMSELDQLATSIQRDKDVDAEHFDTHGDALSARVGAGADASLYQEMTPCTVSGIVHILETSCGGTAKLKGRLCTVIGRSRKLGRPLCTLLSSKYDATVTLCHKETPTQIMKAACLNSDYIFSLVGQPGIVRKSDVKRGAILINVGNTYTVTEGRHELLPDIEESAKEVASVMTPTPHGVGPLPVSFLARQTVYLAEKHQQQLNSCRDADISADELRAQVVDETPPPSFFSTTPTSGSIAALDTFPPNWTQIMCELTGMRVIQRKFKAACFADAVEMLSEVSKIACLVRHHPSNVVINEARECEVDTGQCALVIEYSTMSTGALTLADAGAAHAVEQALQAQWPYAV